MNAKLGMLPVRIAGPGVRTTGEVDMIDFAGLSAQAPLGLVVAAVTPGAWNYARRGVAP